jgi:hypothetical protein
MAKSQRLAFSKKFGQISSRLLPLRQFFIITYQERQRDMAR